jgi:hypothetical protein
LRANKKAFWALFFFLRKIERLRIILQKQKARLQGTGNSSSIGNMEGLQKPNVVGNLKKEGKNSRSRKKY